MKTHPHSVQEFEALYAANVQKIYSYIRAYVREQQDAEDLTQEVFTRAATYLWRNDYTIHDFERWLFKVALNTIRAFLQSRQKHHQISIDQLTSLDPTYSEGIIDTRPSIEEQIEQQEEHQEIQQKLLLAISRLSTSDQDLLQAYLSTSHRGRTPRRIAHILTSLRTELRSTGEGYDGTEPQEVTEATLEELLPVLPPDLAAEFEHLPECYRLPLALSLVSNLGASEIAERLERPLGTVNSWLFRGKQRLDEYRRQRSTPVDPDQFPPELRPRYREVLLLCEVEHLSHDTIAQRLQIDEGNVRILLHRARQQRKALLQQQRQNRPSRRLRPLDEERLQKLLSGDPFFQSHFYSDYAQILRLAYGKEDLTDQQIATRLGLSLGTVKSRLAQAVSYLNSFSLGA